MKKTLYLILVILSCASCDDYLDVRPVGQVIPETVEEYRSFLTSAYSITTSQKVLTTYRGDELALEAGASGVEQYEDLFTWNDLNPSPLTQSYPYASFYNIIFYSNHIIASRNDILGEQEAIDQLIGEAHALRALQYFELVNLYAPPYNPETASQDAAVPITTVYDADREYPVNSVAEVYELIMSDLEQADALINTGQQPLGLNYRFSKVAVKAFKARAYLYQQQWEKALESAEQGLAMQAELQDLRETVDFMPSEYNSVESILALETVASFDLVNNAYISDVLIKAFNPDTDLRFELYFRETDDGSFRSRKSADNKFKASFRTAELYLIRTETLARLGNLEMAKEVLLKLAQKRYTEEGLELYSQTLEGMESTALIREILEERRREFAIEGHRWNDLRRTIRPEIKKVYDGETYILEENDERYVIPFPNDAVINNPNL